MPCLQSVEGYGAFAMRSLAYLRKSTVSCLDLLLFRFTSLIIGLLIQLSRNKSSALFSDGTRLNPFSFVDCTFKMFKPSFPPGAVLWVFQAGAKARAVFQPCTVHWWVCSSKMPQAENSREIGSIVRICSRRAQGLCKAPTFAWLIAIYDKVL